jgi:hypothetical protein
MKTYYIAFVVILFATVLSVGCEINTCDGQDCTHAASAHPCSVTVDSEADSGADVYVWVDDAAPLAQDSATTDSATADARLPDSATSSNDAAAPGACQVNGDCAIDEDCIQGTCLTRCRASCQCRVGEACMQGYCTTGQPVPQSCTTDCDCLAGQSCIAQVCQ